MNFIFRHFVSDRARPLSTYAYTRATTCYSTNDPLLLKPSLNQQLFFSHQPLTKALKTARPQHRSTPNRHPKSLQPKQSWYTPFSIIRGNKKRTHCFPFLPEPLKLDVRTQTTSPLPSFAWWPEVGGTRYPRHLRTTRRERKRKRREDALYRSAWIGRGSGLSSVLCRAHSCARDRCRCRSTRCFDPFAVGKYGEGF